MVAELGDDQSERERQRERKREDFAEQLGCISGTRGSWKARLVPSESASNSKYDRVVNAEGLC